MNEVSSMRGVNNTPAMPASSAGAVKSKQNELVDGNGNKLPQNNELESSGNSKTSNAQNTSTVDLDKQAQDKAKPELHEAVESMNSFVQSVQRDLQFTVDEELDKTIVKVLDSASGDVIRQIPEETFLELARNMKEHGVLRLVDATG